MDSIKLDKLVALDCGGNDYVVTEELMSLLDFVSPNSVNSSNIDHELRIILFRSRFLLL